MPNHYDHCDRNHQSQQALNLLVIFKLCKSGDYVRMVFQCFGNWAKIFKKYYMEGFSKTKILNFKF